MVPAQTNKRLHQERACPFEISLGSASPNLEQLGNSVSTICYDLLQKRYETRQCLGRYITGSPLKLSTDGSVLFLEKSLSRWCKFDRDTSRTARGFHLPHVARRCELRDTSRYRDSIRR